VYCHNGLDATTQHAERDHAPILDINPKERSRLHNLINDPQTANDPTAGDENVRDALAEFLDHRLWEKDPSGPVVGLAKAMIEPPQNMYDLSLKCTKTKIN
jgi:hypothetical protein